jgi:hypothetical protein
MIEGFEFHGTVRDMLSIVILLFDSVGDVESSTGLTRQIFDPKQPASTGRFVSPTNTPKFF